ncbi:cytochrome P450 [Streptomyces sp. HNM0575]|uniref:cytochrome P450 family protein n=1 Tax=Streptomyces sp. HNM0575 TaxID=2716338 RepID=UPI00145E8B07|nr:cytochrome P450 [Streptomyces sp. HNM0575]NLU76577.1 cytochrome P450 [Streptomyces sp. HNM0575]
MPATEIFEEGVYGPAFTADPYAVFAELREHAPVRQVTTHRGLNAWLVTRYDDVRRLLADPRLGKDGNRIGELMARHSEVAGNATGFPAGLTANMVNSDPPDHTRLRNLVGRVFTVRRIGMLRPRVEQIVDGLLDEMARDREPDLVTTLSAQLPIFVIGELLGVPESDRKDFYASVDTLYGGFSAPEQLGKAYADVVGYLRDLCDAKRKTPTDDLLTALVQVSDDEDRLSPDELVSMALLLLTAGHETTSKQLTNGVLTLLRHPDQLAALRADPSRIPAAVEELMRFEGSGLSASLRFTTEPVEVAGVTIPEGEFVLLSLASGNRDGDKFPEPDRFDITRSTSGSLAMGHGIHHCVGAPLGRLELEVALGRLLDRFPDLQPAVEYDAVEWLVNSFFRGPVSLPVRLY